MASTIRKLCVLLSCTALGLVCGTLYVYSSYGPQLAMKLGYSATSASLVALAGNLAVAVLAPLAGAIVDRLGYSFPLLIGVVALLLGYACLRTQFTALYGSLFILCLCLFLVGCGLTFIYLACLKCCAVTFPKHRGVATSLPLATYGLLAMFYSLVAVSFYPGNTEGLLLFLPISVAFIFMLSAPMIMTCEARRLTASKVVSVSEPIMLRPLSAGSKPSPQTQRITLGLYDANPTTTLLLLSPRFWLLFIITGAIASVGQMYIYSVGYMVKALLVYQTDFKSDLFKQLALEEFLQKEQNFQVALLSTANCVGRLVAGFSSDFVRQRLRKPRSWLLFFSGIGLLFSQLVARQILDYQQLRNVSAIIGFMYGFTFCIMPIIVGDVFGITDFSRNWGLMSLAPLIPSNLFTSLFGMVYDSNSITTGEGTHLCILGKECYGSLFDLSLVVAAVALLVMFVFNFGESHLAGRTIFGKRLIR